MAGLTAVGLLVVNPLLFDTMISRPMSEIPSTALLLAGFATSVAAVRRESGWRAAAAEALVGAAANVRETNLILAAPLVVVFGGSMLNRYRTG